MACDDGGIMRESEFIRRVAEAESVIPVRDSWSRTTSQRWFGCVLFGSGV